MFSASKTAGPSGYNINNSLRFRASASAYLNRTLSTPTNNKIWTWSAWVKRSTLTSTQVLFATSGDELRYIADGGASGVVDSFQYNLSTGTYGFRTNATYRDPSAWYHIVVAVDTTQATAANRARIYINGTEASTDGTYGIVQNANTQINSAVAHNVARRTSGSLYFDGYQAETYFVDGQQLTPSSFGSTNSTTGVWQPARYSGTYGTNGFYLNFTDIGLTSGSNTGLGKDFSGNGNYWTTNNISVTAGTTYDAMSDVPTLTSATVANYATWNPLERTAATYSEANLKVVSTSSAAPYNMTSTIQFPTTGKWYCEVEGIKGASNPAIGMGNNIPSDQFAMYRNTGVYLNGGISGIASSGTPATWTTGDIIGIAYDASAGTLSFYKNGTLQSGGFTSIPATGYFVAVRADSASGDGGFINCGQRPFAYTPPTGFVRLNTYNLPDSTIKKGNTVMDATLYTGDGTYPRSLTNTAGFKPDLVWTKARSTAYSHVLYDSVRGTGTGAALFSDSTAAEGSNSGNVNLTSYNSNGWSIGSTSSTNVLNNSGTTFVGWQWQAGQGTNTTNTAGSITSTVSVNTTAGFSIVTYTGNGVANATVGHGLGVSPNLIIVKQRTGTADNWAVSVKLSNLTVNRMYLNSNIADNGLDWVGASSTTLTLKLTDNFVNANGNTYVSYCFASIAGFSKIGSYTGNGSNDGPFIYTGFRPKFVIIKCTSNADSWYMLDTSRSTYNETNQRLFANASSAESSGDAMDILSNGFKNRSNTTINNLNGGTYIYMAFAENPFKNALAR